MQINKETLSKISNMSNEQLKQTIAQIADSVGASQMQKRMAVNNASLIKKKLANMSESDIKKLMSKLDPEQINKISSALKL